MRSFVLLFPLLSISEALAPPATNKCGATAKFNAAPPQRNPFVTSAAAATIFGIAAATPFPAFAAGMEMPHLSVNLGCVLLGYGMIGNIMLSNLNVVDAGLDAAGTISYGVDVDASFEQSVDVTAASIDATAVTIDATLEAGIDSFNTLF
jgi:hypothetical protein